MFAKLRTSIVCFLLLLFTTLAAYGATLNVGAGQTYRTVQSAIDAASNGDTVLIAPGTYYENIDFKGKSITVTSSGGAASTILDGSSLAPVVSFVTGESRSAVLSGLTIQHGAASPTINGVPGGVGGIYISQSQPTLLNNIVTQNQCFGINISVGGPLVQGNEVSATQIVSTNPVGCYRAGGAGIYVGANLNYGSTSKSGIRAVLLGNTIENNVLGGIAHRSLGTREALQEGQFAKLAARYSGCRYGDSSSFCRISL
jgi:parallel beta-helix repeat protein